MTDQLSRITVKDATFSGPLAGRTVITGYIIDIEPEDSAKRDVLRPVSPDEPDSNIEIGYSKNALEPTTLVFKDQKIDLTKTLYVLFRYVYDLYRAEGRMVFDFAELSAVLTGDEFAMLKGTLVSQIRRLAESLVKLRAPFFLTCQRETLCVSCKNATGM